MSDFDNSFFDTQDYKLMREQVFTAIAEAEAQAIPATVRYLKGTMPDDRWLADILDGLKAERRIIASGVTFTVFRVNQDPNDSNDNDWSWRDFEMPKKKTRRPDYWGEFA